MTRKSVGIASVLIVATMLAAAVVAGTSLPDDVQLPVHWGADGEPDDFAGKWPALLLPSGVIAAVSMLFWFIPALEPRQEGLQRSQGLYLWGWIGMLMTGPAIQLSVLSVAFDWGIPVNHLIIGVIGLLLVMIGNQLGKSRRMYLIGLRTPRTLASEEVWIRTHRLAGKLLVAAGLVMVAAALLPVPAGLLTPVTIAAVAVSAIVPILYSFLLWRREQAAGQARE